LSSISAKPHDTAPAVAFLASSDAAWITGETQRLSLEYAVPAKATHLSARRIIYFLFAG
jgi:hypothetical protein